MLHTQIKQFKINFQADQSRIYQIFSSQIVKQKETVFTKMK
jgi:hypothetical protein